MEQGRKNQLVNGLKNHKLSAQDIADKLKIPLDEVQGHIQELRDEHIPVVLKTAKDGEDLYHINMLPAAGNVYVISEGDGLHRRMDFGLISDIHFASKFHLPETFHDTVKWLEDQGITKVYCAGDVVDGVGIYKGHLENIVTNSIEEQTDIAAEAFSMHPGIEFWSIAGNHDYSFTQKNGAKPLAIIESKVDNFKNLGDLRADVVFHGIKIRLLHGGQGRTYARSYPSQVYLRDLFAGSEREEIANMPHIIGLGHYHTVYQGKDHGIWILQPGSFQDGDNEYCLRRGLTGPSGGFKVKVNYHSSSIDRFQTEYMQPPVQKLEKGTMHARNTRNY